ncbi:MAG: hypothetical protein FK730_09530 [Asgard group archaeon]|nr:hypothetical protein [Asgard group archaeon]
MSTETKANKEENDEIKKSRVTWNEIIKHPTKRLIDYVGPTGIWLLSYYISSLFMMVVLNIARTGWSFEAIFAAPLYMAQIFINYGLNSGKVKDDIDPYNAIYYERSDINNAMTSGAWLFAPLLIYVLGIFFVILPGSGFPQPLGDYNFETNFMYFHQFVPFLNENKGGGFYFLIVWLPLILSILIGAFVSKRFFKGKKQPIVSLVKVFVFNLLAGFAVGLQMGVVTGGVEFNLRGAFQTILTSDYDNIGYFFYGEYHPNTIMITSWFINFIPTFMAIAWYALYGNLEDLILGKKKRVALLAAEEIEKEIKKEPVK